MNRSFVLCIAAGMLLLCAAPSWAQGKAPDDGLGFLPQVCQDRLRYGQLPNHPTTLHWLKVLGGGYSYLHHYCYGLEDIAKASRYGVTDAERQHYLRGAVGEINFVLARTDETFLLRYAMLLAQADAWTKLRNWPKAQAVLQSAIELKPEEEVGYYRLAEVQLSAGQRTEARGTLEKGLQRKPGSTSLQRLLQSIPSSGKP